MAKITDANGLSYLTPVVDNISLVRPRRSVKMHKPSDVPERFGVRVKQQKSCLIPVPDALSNAVAARLVLSTWSAATDDGSIHEIRLNGQRIGNNFGKFHDYSFDALPVPIELIQSGANEVSIYSEFEGHALEINWPGPVLFIDFLGDPKSKNHSKNQETGGTSGTSPFLTGVVGCWNMRMGLLGFLGLLALSFAMEGGRTFVVSPEGNDNNAGTELRPWKTLAKAAREAGPRETVLIQHGTYVAPVVLTRSGTATRPIVFRNFPGETPVINGAGSTRFGIILDRVRFVHLIGFEIQEIRTPHPRSREVLHEQGGILLRESSDCRIEDNRIITGGRPGYTEEQPGATGIQLWSKDPEKGCHRNTVRGNEIANCAYGVHVRGPAWENVFESNYWHDNQEMQDHSDGIKFESIDFELNHPREHVASYEELAEASWSRHTPRRNIIRYNVAEDNSDDGIDTWVSVENVIEFNLCSGSGVGPKQGDGNGFKLGPGGRNRVRWNLSRDNRVKAFTDNSGPHNLYENNLALGARSDGGNGVLLLTEREEWLSHPLRTRILKRIQEELPFRVLSRAQTHFDLAPAPEIR